MTILSTHPNKNSLLTTLYNAPFLNNFLSLIFILFHCIAGQDVWSIKLESQGAKI